MDIQFNNLKQEKGAIGIIFCDHNCSLIGYGKKLDQLSKKHLSNTISSDESFKSRKSKNFDYLIIPVSYTHLRAHETKANLVCRLQL